MRILAAMSIWGKMAGVAAGLALGGPIGALIGGMAGHLALDRNTKGGRKASNEVAFTVGVIALGAKMAKADGIVTADEVEAFKEVFKVPEGEMKNVARIFDLAKQDVAGYEAYADQLANLFKDNRDLLEDVVEGLFHIAKADGVLHENEEAFLASVSSRFGFSPTEFKYIKSRHIISHQRNPYDVLQVTPEMADDEIKKQYRTLVRENHPDRAIARGVPQEFVELADKKLAAINTAYEEIRKERGF